MNEPVYTAATVRLCGYVLPEHIPDHAWIFERDTQNITVGGSWADGRITSVRNWPTFPPEKFHYYRKHGNARLLVSRNKREGGYLGWRVLTAAKRGQSWIGRNKPGHQRLGGEIMIDTLRQLVKANRSRNSRAT